MLVLVLKPGLPVARINNSAASARPRMMDKAMAMRRVLGFITSSSVVEGLQIAQECVDREQSRTMIDLPRVPIQDRQEWQAIPAVCGKQPQTGLGLLVFLPQRAEWCEP